MAQFAGQIVDGKVVFENGSPPEGARVVVRIVDSGDTFAVSDEDRDELLNRIESSRRGHVVDAREHLRSLREQR